METPLSRMKGGFSLVELLFVLSIIALLTAILLPVLHTARGKARETVCLSNVRQIGIAIALYAHDYDEYYPYAADGADKYAGILKGDDAFKETLANMPFLQDALTPYVKNREIWRCPSDSGYTSLDLNEDADGTPIPLDARPTAYGKFGSSYLYRTMLAFLHIRYATFEANDMFRREPPKQSSELVILYDGNGSWHGGRFDEQKRFNTLMGDGHARSLTYEHCKANLGLQEIL